VLVRVRLLRSLPGTSGSPRQARACGRPTVEIEPPVFCEIGKVLRFLYLCQVRPRPSCCAIVGPISRGASILPVLAPRGRCAVTGEVSSGSGFSAPERAQRTSYSRHTTVKPGRFGDTESGTAAKTLANRRLRETRSAGPEPATFRFVRDYSERDSWRVRAPLTAAPGTPHARVGGAPETQGRRQNAPMVPCEAHGSCELRGTPCDRTTVSR
jgi:hypothetical protein